MDISLLIRSRLKELGLEQKDLAAAAEVTDSYISQLLSRKKAPPAPGRTDIYEKLSAVLNLPAGELARLANLQRQEELKKKVADPARPLFEQRRELVLRKCVPEKLPEIRHIFSKEPFGELERLITQTLLEVAQDVAKAELRNEDWPRRIAPLSGRTHEQARVAVLEFLDTDVFDVSVDSCASVLEPMIDAWDIDIRTFAIEVTLNPSLTSAGRKRFAFSELPPPRVQFIEPGLKEFLKNPSLCGDIREEEIEFLKSLKFPAGSRPCPLYYYRELQNLRDPLHFLNSPQD